MKRKIEELSKENLQEILLRMTELLTEKQREKLERIIEECTENMVELESIPPTARMSQEFVDEKMQLLKSFMNKIDEGELYLDVDEYEDYSGGYWDSEWITDYYDNQGIGDGIASAIQFAKECVDDRRYQEAVFIYNWLWEMSASTDEEYECEPVDLEMMAENGIIHTDMEKLALLTLYADYQVQEADKRAKDIYLYFSHYTFKKLHIEDMFHMGRENLIETEKFWHDWIALLQTKSGEAEGRLLKEAILYSEGIEGLVKTADENCSVHPSLYLAAMLEYERRHDYQQIEKIGERALEKIDSKLKIRSKAALIAAYASSCLMHTDKVMRFCFEGFRSDSTVRNFLRLFGTKEMAEKYGIRGGETLRSSQKGNPVGYRNEELCQNIVDDYSYYSLSFYMGDFKTVKEASKNPHGSLGWSSRFIRYGIRLFLLYLYEKTLPSKAAASIAEYVGFREESDSGFAMDFENEIIEESRKYKTSIFWNYFQRWKVYYQMTQDEKKKYFSWAKKIVYGRADAIVSGQHRRHYGEVAALLAIVAEIKEYMEVPGTGNGIFMEYKRKFPRHSSFQAEMKYYFSE